MDVTMIPTIHTDLPKLYLRGEISDKRVKDLKEIWKAAQADMKKGQPPTWPFDPLDVRSIAKPTKEQKDMGIIYEVIDGVHRRQMALEIPIIYLPAIIHDDLDDKAAAFLQWERTTRSALNFTRKSRDSAIRTLATLLRVGQDKGMTQDTLAARLMLSASTISRVLKAIDKKPHGGARVWNDETWFNRLYKVSNEYREHFDSITAHMQTSFPDQFNDFTSAMQLLHDHIMSYPSETDATPSNS